MAVQGKQEESESKTLERDFQLTLQQLPKVIQRLTVQTLVRNGGEERHSA